MTDNIDKSSSKVVIEEYVDACRVGSADRLRLLFLSDSIMSGFFEDEFYIGSPDYFFDEIRDNPPPYEPGKDYVCEITSVEEFGSIANVVLKEKGYLGSYDLTNLFQLVKINGDWKIASKTYSDM